MVTAGFPATVAPLGTALTEDQLALLWKMADEPILCFDGDKAGQRAAFRAVDLAMPRLKPGKSLRFALLPEGQDPDDLARSGGREAIAEVLGGARPLADMLWTRETEGDSFDTPERRAALEARINEVVRSIGDESVRKYYAQDFQARLRAVAGAAARPGRGERPRRHGRQRRALRGKAGPEFPRFRPRPGLFRARPAKPARADAADERAAIRQPDRARLPQRAAAARGADPARGGQPSLAAGAARRAVRRARIPQSGRRPAPPRGHGRRDGASDRRSLGWRCARRLRRGGSPGVLDRVEAAITHTSDWPARAGASADDVAQWWDPRCYLASQAAHAK